MDVHSETTFPADLPRVVAMLADPGYVRERCERTLGTDVVVDVQRRDDGGFVVTSERTLPTDDAPAMAKPFVGDGLRVRQVDTWGPAADGTWSGTSDVEVQRAPATMTSRARLQAAGSGTRQVVHGTVTASVPFVGRKLEELMRTQVLRALDKEQQVAAEWLARG